MNMMKRIMAWIMLVAVLLGSFAFAETGASTHEHSPNADGWQSSSDYHWFTCAVCGEEIKESHLENGWQGNEKGANETAVLAQVIDRVVHCHAKDINPERVCVAVGDGIVNVKGCVELLKQHGYSGVVSVETEGGDDFDQVVALAQKSYRYLESIIKA